MIAETLTVEPPACADLVGRAVGLHELIRGGASRSDAERRVPDEVVAALTGAGLCRLGTPRRYGGYEAPLGTWLEVCSAVAEADGSAGWLSTLFNAGAYIVALFPEQAQREVFGSDPDTLVCGVIAPTSRSRRTDGGWRVSGRWYYASGSLHARWAVLGTPVTDAAGESVDQGVVLVPRDQLALEDTWFTTGMRGSGSNCLIAQDVFVPAHRMASVSRALEGAAADASGHGDSALYRSNVGSVLCLVLTAPLLGLGRAALGLVREQAATKSVPYSRYTRQADSTAFQLQLAEAALRIDTAHLHARRAAEDVDRAGAEGRPLAPFLRARVRADTGYAAENTTRALDLLMSAHGAAGFAESSALQRIWRDVGLAARHGSVSGAVGYEAFGQVLAGLEQNVTPMI
ncbi:acyl-CoA dehydrogenase family protein [Streptomyces sp. NPDC088789]|uniref:acyl-CoA dehydrogenase family protein n=1 Tax=Streptomyces sp. NPDC088789 TaxID=3365899 RepID=UPI0038048847